MFVLGGDGDGGLVVVRVHEVGESQTLERTPCTVCDHDDACDLAFVFGEVVPGWVHGREDDATATQAFEDGVYHDEDAVVGDIGADDKAEYQPNGGASDDFPPSVLMVEVNSQHTPSAEGDPCEWKDQVHGSY